MDAVAEKTRTNAAGLGVMVPLRRTRVLALWLSARPRTWEKFGGRVLHHLIKHSFQGQIIPVHPNRPELFGLVARDNGGSRRSGRRGGDRAAGGMDKTRSCMDSNEDAWRPAFARQ